MSEKEFKDVDKNALCLFGELYGKIAGLHPHYSEENFFGFITIEQSKAIFDGERIRFKDLYPYLFSCQWSEGQNPAEVVADAFIDYIHAIDPENPIAMERSTVEYVMHYVISCESVVSAVFDQLRDKIITQPDKKIIIPNGNLH